MRGRSVDHITKRQIQEFIDSTVENAKILRQFGFEMFSFHNAYHNGTMAEFWSTHTITEPMNTAAAPQVGPG